MICGMQGELPLSEAGSQFRLARQCIIFTQGPTATFKTSLTEHLGNRLCIAVVATHQAGKITNAGVLDQGKRAERYAQTLQEAGLRVGRQESVILDGVFDEPQWRQEVYRLAAASRSHLILIKTQCNSIDLIKERLQRRASHPDLPDSEMADLSFWHLTSDAVARSPAENDCEFRAKHGDLITVETGTPSGVSYFLGASDDAVRVADEIRRGLWMLQ